MCCQKIKYFFCAVLLMTALRPQIAVSQTIRSEKLPDGVVRYYHVGIANEKHWFFQQIEKVFDVVVGTDKKLPFGRSVAFLAGVSEYEFLTDLPFVQNDIRDMSEFLLGDGGFDEVYIAYGDIVTDDLLNLYMRETLKNKLRSGDRLLFYYAGHGDDNEGAKGYLQFSKARSKRFYGDYVFEIERAIGWMDELKDVSHFLMLFDACASGLAIDPASGRTGDLINALSRNGSRIVVTAGTAQEKTFEINGNGIFTRAFLNTVRRRNSVYGKDGLLTIEEIYVGIQSEIAEFSRRSKQTLTPRLWPLNINAYPGTFVFVYPLASEQKAVLLEEDQKLLNARASSSEEVGAYGTMVVQSDYAGRLFIDDNEQGEVLANTEKQIFLMPIGRRIVKLVGIGEQDTAIVEVQQGQVARAKFRSKHPPETPDSSQTRYQLRSSPQALSINDIRWFIQKYDFYAGDRTIGAKRYSNLNGKGIANQYQILHDGKAIYDAATGLTWQ